MGRTTIQPAALKQRKDGELRGGAEGNELSFSPRKCPRAAYLCASALTLRCALTYALARQHTDMKEEMRTEAIEVIVSSVEKFAGKYDLAVRLPPRLFVSCHVLPRCPCMIVGSKCTSHRAHSAKVFIITLARLDVHAR